MTAQQAQIQKLDGQKWHVLEYANMADFLADADIMPAFQGYKASRKTDGSYGGDWNGTKTFEEASKIAREGWADGLARITALTEKISTTVGTHVIKTETHHDVSGAYVDVGRFMTGEPECMVSFNEELKRGTGGRIVRISVDVCASAHVAKEAMFRRGAAIIALIDALEKAGFIAEVECLQLIGGRSGADRFALRIPIKKAGETVEMDRIAYIFAHASMLRRHVFAVEELQSEEFRARFNIGNGYGMPMRIIPEALKEEGQICIDGMGIGGRQWDSESTAIAWVLEQLRAQGVLQEA